MSAIYKCVNGYNLCCKDDEPSKNTHTLSSGLLLLHASLVQFHDLARTMGKWLAVLILAFPRLYRTTGHVSPWEALCIYALLSITLYS
jgi:hypothetical protein